MNDLNIFNLNLESRKKNTNFIINYTEKILNQITNNNQYLNGVIIFAIHALLLILTLIMFFSKNKVLFNIAVIFCIFIILGHFYFGGCIFIRMERYFFNTKNWWGPWMVLFTPLQCFGVAITPKLANQIFISWGCLLMIYILVQYSYM